jgi:uncharacterized delta-60 repeat protein
MGSETILRLNSDGGRDLTFHTPRFAPDLGEAIPYILGVVAQPDGKLLVGGRFTGVDGVSRNSLARLNNDGTLDEPFTPYTPFGCIISSLAIQPNGKILAAVRNLRLLESQLVVRLNPDGSLDTTFTSFPEIATQFIWIDSVRLQENGKVLISGSPGLLARLNADGSRDGTLDLVAAPRYSFTSTAPLLDANGRILVGFSTRFSTPSGGFHLLRLNVDGSSDANFLSLIKPYMSVHSIAVQDDGKILMGGLFDQAWRAHRAGIARFQADGSLDESFDAGIAGDGEVGNISLQNDGKILVTGEFSFLSGSRPVGIARLNQNGSADQSFQSPFEAVDFPDCCHVPGGVRSIAVQADGKILVTGDFPSVGRTIRPGIARLNPTGSLDLTFNPDPAFVSGSFVLVQPDQKVLISASGIYRLNTDGGLDPSFGDGSGLNGSGVNVWAVKLALQPDAKLLVVGDGLHRRNSDGTLDKTFWGANVGGSFGGCGGSISATALQASGKILITGVFDQVNGVVRRGIARLNPDGTLDEGFDPGAGITETVRGVHWAGRNCARGSTRWECAGRWRL